MKLPNTKIEVVAAKDKTRPVLSNVHLDVEHKRLVATNGHSLAVNPVEVDDQDTSGPISPEAIKLARKSGRKWADRHILANGDLRVPLAGVSLDRPEDEREYPDFDQIVPRVDAENTPASIALDAKLLYELSQAICEDGNRVILWINPVKHGPIYVKPATVSSENYGVIMPVNDARMG